MRKRNRNTNILMIGQVIVLFGIIVTFASAKKAEPTEHIIEMQKMKFVPPSITIKLGDTIKFVNKSKYLHNVVAKKLKIRTKYVKKGKSVTIKPKKTGKYEYFCQPHRTKGMTGTIKIKD